MRVSQLISVRFLFFVLLISVLTGSPTYAISEGGKCNSSKYGNSLAMRNGKIHGGEFGPNKNYVGPLYLCDGGRWIYWRNAEPAAPKAKTINVRPGQGCDRLGRIVESTNYGTLVCDIVRAGKVRALIWIQN